MTYADVAKGSSSDDFRPTSPSPEEKRNTQQTSKKGSTNNKTQQQTTKKSKLIPEKTISTVMTGYTPEDKANVHEIVIYDIPSTMSQLDILTNLGKWDQILASNFAILGSSVILTEISHFEILVTRDLSCFSNVRGPALTNWNNGVWTAPFGEMPVR
ncbi:unnamed protein product [Rhizophagus irregularis]|nr:unnamed protein product [Rhizophagus irregularis]